jgi:hypothetical protein
MKNMRTQKARKILCLTASTLLVLGIATVVASATCQQGCTNDRCYEMYADCFHFTKKSCFDNDIWLNNDRGSAPGGNCTEYDGPDNEVSMESMDTCHRECGHDRSRALNEAGESTCDDLVDATPVLRMTCQDPS